MAGYARGSARAGAAARLPRAGEANIFEKTQQCKFFAKGRCTRGAACAFAHGSGDLREQPDLYKTQLCVDFYRSTGCPVGEACRFAHSPEEVRRRPGAPTQGLPLRRSRRGAPEEAQEQGDAKAMQARLATLQAELQALHTTTSPFNAFQAFGTPPPPPAFEQDKMEIVFAPEAFSRQSTMAAADRSPNTAPSSVDDAVWSDDGCGTWCGDFDYQGDVEEGEDAEEPIPCELVVQKTFFVLAAAAPAGARRRVQSAPPPVDRA